MSWTVLVTGAASGNDATAEAASAPPATSDVQSAAPHAVVFEDTFDGPAGAAVDGSR